MSSSVSSSSSRLVLVHGTFSGQDSDRGESWWQIGGHAWQGFQTRLPPQVVNQQPGELFHWSGENSERARLKAGSDLLAYLQKLESQGIRYHLVGHSHGGSVIWHALRMSVHQRKALKGLTSWATVGTPFLHLRTRSRANLFNWINLLLAILLIRPAIQTFANLLRFILPPESFERLGVQKGTATNRITLWNDPVPWLLQKLGQPVEATNHGWQVGSLPTADDCTVFTLVTTAEGWLLLAVAGISIYVFLNLAGFFLSPVLESMRLRSEHRLEEKTFSVFGSRWLGLWSPDDEAINGLRATLDLSVTFFSRMMLREPVLLSDYLGILSRPYYWLAVPIFNLHLRPVLDSAMRTVVIKKAQGNNRPAAEVVRIATVPYFSAADDLVPPIPSELNNKIVDQANLSAGTAAADLRRLLACPSFSAGLQQLGMKISGRELVHTSYFDHPEVIDLLVMHLAWAEGVTLWTAHSQTRQSELVNWLIDTKSRVGAVLVDPDVFAASSGITEIKRIKPRRRLWTRAA
jgi:hypothetical protein